MPKAPCGTHFRHKSAIKDEWFHYDPLAHHCSSKSKLIYLNEKLRVGVNDDDGDNTSPSFYKLHLQKAEWSYYTTDSDFPVQKTGVKKIIYSAWSEIPNHCQEYPKSPVTSHE